MHPDTDRVRAHLGRGALAALGQVRSQPFFFTAHGFVRKALAQADAHQGLVGQAAGLVQGKPGAHLAHLAVEVDQPVLLVVPVDADRHGLQGLGQPPPTPPSQRPAPPAPSPMASLSATRPALAAPRQRAGSHPRWPGQFKTAIKTACKTAFEPGVGPAQQAACQRLHGPPQNLLQGSENEGQ